MKLLICLSILASAYGADIKVTWPTLTSVPAKLDDVKANNWVLTERPDDGYLPELTLYCPADDVTICTLYDDLGDIAGYQIAMDKTKLENQYPTDLTTVTFVSWSESRTGAEYWTQQIYFVSEEYLTQSADVRAASRTVDPILPESVVYVRAFDGSMFKISNVEEDILNGGFTKQYCTPTMGRHYYYQMSKQSDCSKLFPWFPLIQQGKMVGIGYFVIGKWVQPSTQVWFENFGGNATRQAIPDGPQCLFDLSDSPGTPSLHVYFNHNPLPIRVC